MVRIEEREIEKKKGKYKLGKEVDEEGNTQNF